MNIIKIIENNCKRYPDKLAYAKVGKQGIEKKITYRELLKKVKRAALYLEEMDDVEKVIIMLPSCIEYIIMFFAALFCHKVAVPAYPVTNSHHKERLMAILENSQAQLIITDNHTKEKICQNFKDICEGILILEANELLEENREEEFMPVETEEDDIAYLQYTSGSTRDAKGVIISYKNIVSNESAIKRSMQLDEKEKIVCWLPFYHDMGLIGNIILTVFLGASCYFMSPVEFIQSPLMWLKIVSCYGGTMVTAPNFAFQMCVDEVEESELESLHLETLKNAINGAEPVRRITLETFIEKFSSSGFKARAMKPSYGLAENTLLATTYENDPKYKYKILNKDKLSQNIVQYDETGIEVVSSGKLLPEVDIKIWDSAEEKILGDREIGEICISSESASIGYWNQLEENQCFGLSIDNSKNQYFNTGDIGFVDEQYLYIIGRIKDIIIIRGKNYYPQDIELAAENSNMYIKKDSSAAFPILIDGEEKLVVVSELDKHLRSMKNDSLDRIEEKHKKRTAAIDAIYKNIVLEYSIEPYDIVLIQEKSIPKTSSGKIQRQLCKKQYLEKELKIWQQMKEI